MIGMSLCICLINKYYLSSIETTLKVITLVHVHNTGSGFTTKVQRLRIIIIYLKFGFVMFSKVKSFNFKKITSVV